MNLADVESFRACLDEVAREGRFLALVAAPPIEHMRGFVSENVAKGVPQVVAKDGEVVVGWCDISPGWHDTLQHCGSLGMGVLREYRGRGIGSHDSSMNKAQVDRTLQRELSERTNWRSFYDDRERLCPILCACADENRHEWLDSVTRDPWRKSPVNSASDLVGGPTDD